MILRIAVATLFVLIACTIISSSVYRLLLPEVRVEKAFPGADGKTLLVPQTSVYFDYSCDPPQAFLYAVQESGSIWGKGYIVEKLDVTYIGEDYRYVEIAMSSHVRNASIALYPTRELYRGAVVSVNQPGASK